MHGWVVGSGWLKVVANWLAVVFRVEWTKCFCTGRLSKKYKTMRYVSQIFQPVITIPKNAKLKNTEITCKSQKLLLECGLVRPSSSGLFTLLPLARRAIDKLERLIREYIEGAGAQRLSLSSLTSAGLWDKTGRLQDVGSELLKVKDRHDKEYLLSPTHEEAITDLLADVGPLSYKQLPLLLYQISNKYRDEARPKHGLLRAREFAMMDAYSAHVDGDCARHVYQKVTEAYRRLFKKLQLPVYRVEAPSGEMGGSLSHEWQLRAAAGEDALALCSSCSHAALALDDASACVQCGRETNTVNSIEVGHTFVLGTRYSGPLAAQCTPAMGAPVPLHMSCYGIGVTRLLAASLEALSTETSLRWPRSIAPYTLMLIGPKEGSKEWATYGWEQVDRLGGQLETLGGDVLVDDRHHLTIGKRLLAADRMGYPYIVVCGKSTLDHPTKYELYRSGSTDSTPQLMSLKELVSTLSDELHIAESDELEDKLKLSYK